MSLEFCCNIYMVWSELRRYQYDGMCPASHVSLVQASNSGVRCGEHFFGPLHHAMMLIWTKISENISLNVCNKELRQFKSKRGSKQVLESCSECVCVCVSKQEKRHISNCTASAQPLHAQLYSLWHHLWTWFFFYNKNYSVFSGHLCNISKTTASCKISLPVISCLPAEFKNKGKNSTCLQWI